VPPPAYKAAMIATIANHFEINFAESHEPHMAGRGRGLKRKGKLLLV